MNTWDTCCYAEPGEQRCGQPAADPDAEILLCTHHLALAMRLVRARQEQFVIGVAAGKG